MPLLGVQFKAFEARRYQDAPAGGQVRVDHNSNLSQVTEEGDRLRIDFAFTTSYGPLGMVKIEGTAYYKAEDNGAVVEQWSKTRNLPPDDAQAVHSGILGSCVPETVLLARDLRLPPPLPIPQVKFGQKGEASTKTTPTDPGVDAA